MKLSAHLVDYPAHPRTPNCWPGADDCQKLHCYTCGRYDGVKHRGGSGPNGELLFDDVHRWWWNHNWLVRLQPNGAWVRQFPGGNGHLLSHFTPEPDDRSGRKARYAA